ncbi:hypothetical protein GKKCFE_24260 [Pseudomonas sp. E141]|uniref:hypothetical protein n=1 Tax=Pseudomonas sp. E141 TaxID=2875961 RepID=UPI0040463D9E
MEYEDLTTFDREDRNKWVDGDGAVDARVVTEGENSFWSGKIEGREISMFKPSLRKIFNIDPRLMGNMFLVTYRYRFKQEVLHYIQIAMTNDKHQIWAGTLVHPGTPGEEWQDSETFAFPFTPNNREMLLGLRVGKDHAGTLYEFEIDNIRVKMVS